MSKSDYLKQMEDSGLLMKSQMTREDYLNELLGFQDMLSDIVIHDGEKHHMEEIKVDLWRAARKKGVEKELGFNKGLYSLNQLDKEISVSISGKRAENRVTRTLDFVTKPCYKYRNIYITDETRETELDNLVLTKDGFIILEVKSVKEDITITENGRMVYSGRCYHDISICDKLQDKEDLLRVELEKKMAEKGISIPIRIDSYLVLSAPRNVFINVNNKCKKIKYRFTSVLPGTIDNYCSTEQYSDDDLSTLDHLINELETQKKCFDLPLDFDTIRAGIAGALDLCFAPDNNQEPSTEKVVVADDPNAQNSEEEKIVDIREYRWRRAKRFGAVAVAAGIATMLATKLKS